jgi:hypothetical protein
MGFSTKKLRRIRAHRSLARTAGDIIRPQLERWRHSVPYETACRGLWCTARSRNRRIRPPHTEALCRRADFRSPEDEVDSSERRERRISRKPNRPVLFGRPGRLASSSRCAVAADQQLFDEANGGRAELPRHGPADRPHHDPRQHLLHCLQRFGREPGLSRSSADDRSNLPGPSDYTRERPIYARIARAGLSRWHARPVADEIGHSGTDDDCGHADHASDAELGYQRPLVARVLDVILRCRLPADRRLRRFRVHVHDFSGKQRVRRIKSRVAFDRQSFRWPSRHVARCMVHALGQLGPGRAAGRRRSSVR